MEFELAACSWASSTGREGSAGDVTRAMRLNPRASAKGIIAAAVAATALWAGPASAQVALKPDTPFILFWTPEQQSAGYRALETIYKSETIQSGSDVRELPKAAHEIAPTWTHDGRTWTVDEYMAAYRTSGVLVLKDGEIVLERYGMDRTPAERWTSFSVAKSVTSTLVGAAIKDGKIESLESNVADYIPELVGSAYDGVTVRQLLTMTSGVKWNEDYADPKSDVAQAGFADIEPGINPLLAYMRKLPRAAEPGTTFNYSTGETDMAGILVSNAVGMPLSQYLSEKIWRPYGMESDAYWQTDLAGRERAGCCISATLRDFARIGAFVMDGGKVGDERVVPDGWVEQATQKQVDNGYNGYGYFWWMRPDGGYDALGVYGQSITTFRSDRVVIVVNSAWPTAVGADLEAAAYAFQQALHEAANHTEGH
ncbi:6-aminohexanoate-dimer hydrolase [compost metagenome]